MKRFLKLLIAVIAFLLIWHFGIPAITGALVRGQMTQALNDGRQLTLAIQQYRLDKKTLGELTEKEFPKSLDQLVQENYLTKETLENLGRNFSVTYSPPPANAAPDFVYLALNDKNSERLFRINGDIPLRNP